VTLQVVHHPEVHREAYREAYTPTRVPGRHIGRYTRLYTTRVYREIPGYTPPGYMYRVYTYQACLPMYRVYTYQACLPTYPPWCIPASLRNRETRGLSGP